MELHLKGKVAVVTGASKACQSSSETLRKDSRGSAAPTLGGQIKTL
ncbi:hypothetical protein ACFYPN_07785 [Streptomyces sp. NPDC005576]